MKVKTSHRPSVTTVYVIGSRRQTCLGGGTVVPVGLIDAAFLGADPEGRGLIIGEVKAGDGDLVGLVV